MRKYFVPSNQQGPCDDRSKVVLGYLMFWINNMDMRSVFETMTKETMEVDRQRSDSTKIKTKIFLCER